MKYDKVFYGTAKSDNIDAYTIAYSSQLVALYGLGGNDTLWSGDFMDGGDGDDTIYDGVGDSIIYGGAGNDTIFDFEGNDVVYAGSGDDYFSFDVLHSSDGDKKQVFLGSGNDTGVMMLADGDFLQNIDGGTGFDTLVFSPAWADEDSLARVMDFRKLNGGSMTIDGSIVMNFERVVLTDTWKAEVIYFGEYDDVFMGSGTNNRVYGFGGNDILRAGVGGVRPGSGGDYLFGGEGNDIIVAAGGTRVDFHRAYGEAGNDRIYASFDKADNHSNSRLYGGQGKDGFIHTFNNVISGEKEKFDYVMDFDVEEDWIGLGTGAYFSFDLTVTRPISLKKTNIVDDEKKLSFQFEDVQGDGPYGIPVKVTYVKASGKLYIQDDLFSAPTLILSFKGAPDLLLKNFYYMTQQNGYWAKDLLHGDGKDNVLQGAGENDIIYGADGNDTILGDGNEPWDEGGPPGNDTLFGEKGNDIIYGDAGKDKLTGGLGQDHLWGEAGSDTFIYGSVADSTVDSSGRDTIYDFSRTDKIDLSGIDANKKISGNQAFTYIGKSAFHGIAGELRFEKKVSDTYMYADVDGDKKADFSIHFDDAVDLLKECFVL